MRKVALILSLLLTSLLGVSAGAQVQPATGFEQKAMDATFALYGHREIGGKTYAKFLCTATAVEKVKTGYFLISAGHCAADQPSDVTFAVSEQIGGPQHPVQPVIARLQGSQDVMKLYFPSTKNYPVIDLGTETTEQVGESIINPNFTQGWVKQLANGIIASQVMTSPTAAPFL